MLCGLALFGISSSLDKHKKHIYCMNDGDREKLVSGSLQ
jgi:hypothetical protein